ncbi:MAG: hypothetical protein ACE5EZ_01795 [Thermodesulfobacteriota bacterium]
MRKKLFSSFFVLIFSLCFAGVSYAEMGGQVFYRFGYAKLDNDRGGEVFTDTQNALGKGLNDGTTGWNISGGLDLPLTSAYGPGTLLGEVMLSYSQFSDKEVTQTSTTLLLLDGIGPGSTEKVTVSEFMAVIAPKYRLDLMDGKLRPWIIPAGLAFLVNSPPTNDSNYLDIGYHLGVGLDYRIYGPLSIGADFRYTIASGEPGIKATNYSAAGYLGINF